MIKGFGVIVVLGSVFALVGCVGAPEALDTTEEGATLRDEAEGPEDIGSVEQAVTNGAVNAACAQSLTLRNAPGGATIGTMYSSAPGGLSKFYVQSTSGGWSYGYSYSLNQWGYAMSYYLTTDYHESGTPGVFGYSFSCGRSDGSGMGAG